MKASWGVPSPRFNCRVATMGSALAALFLLVLSSACSGDGQAVARPGTPKDAEDAGNARPAARAKAKPGAPVLLPVLSLDGLFGAQPPADETAAAQPSAARNLFAFEEDPAVVAERQRQMEEAQKASEAAAKKAAEEAAKQQEYIRANPPPPQPPAITFTFIGYMGQPENRIGVFSVPGSNGLVLAKAGDHIAQRFIVKEVGYESAEIGFDGFTETKRITLTPGGSQP